MNWYWRKLVNHLQRGLTFTIDIAGENRVRFSTYYDRRNFVFNILNFPYMGSNRAYAPFVTIPETVTKTRLPGYLCSRIFVFDKVN